MARDKSAVLSAADKKAVVTDLKNKIKESQASVKAASAILKADEKVLAATVRDLTKSHQVKAKELIKAIAATTKVVIKLEADLSAITQA